MIQPSGAGGSALCAAFSTFVICVRSAAVTSRIPALHTPSASAQVGPASNAVNTARTGAVRFSFMVVSPSYSFPSRG